MNKREDEYQVVILQAHKFDNVCCYAQRHANEMLQYLIHYSKTVLSTVWHSSRTQDNPIPTTCVYSGISISSPTEMKSWRKRHANDQSLLGKEGKEVNIFLCDIDFVEGSLVGELARRSIQKFCNTARLLRYKNHICYVTNINVFFTVYRCSICDQFFLTKLETGN